MSHVVEIKTTITDLAALQLACKELGFTFVPGQTRYHWFGKWVGDSPMPEGMTKADLGKCDHAIKIPGCKYEVGVRKREGGFTLAYDYWERSLNKKLGQNAGPLMQSYAKHKTIREATRMGYRIADSKVLEDGSIKLTVQQGGAW